MKLLNSLISKYKEMQQNAANKAEFQAMVMAAVSDGKLSAEEIEQINQKKEEFGLTDAQLRDIKVQAFMTAYKVAAGDKRISAEEEKELQAMQEFFGLQEHEVGSTKKDLARFRLLHEIQTGNIPTVPVENIIMQKGERGLWVEPAHLVEEKVLRRRYVGGSSGASFRIAKGLSYRVGSYRGHSVSETGYVIVSTGDLILTSRRIIFRGDKKSFAIKLENLLDIQIFSNGVHFSENGRGKMRIVKYAQPGNQDILGAIASYAINNLHKE